MLVWTLPRLQDDLSRSGYLGSRFHSFCTLSSLFHVTLHLQGVGSKTGNILADHLLPAPKVLSLSQSISYILILNQINLLPLSSLIVRKFLLFWDTVI